MCVWICLYKETGISWKLALPRADIHEAFFTRSPPWQCHVFCSHQLRHCIQNRISCRHQSRYPYSACYVACNSVIHSTGTVKVALVHQISVYIELKITFLWDVTPRSRLRWKFVRDVSNDIPGYTALHYRTQQSSNMTSHTVRILGARAPAQESEALSAEPCRLIICKFVWQTLSRENSSRIALRFDVKCVVCA
jgi:hypothetical protein